MRVGVEQNMVDCCLMGEGLQGFGVVNMAINLLLKDLGALLKHYYTWI